MNSFCSIRFLFCHLAAGNQAGLFAVPADFACFGTDVQAEISIINKGFFVFFFYDVSCRANCCIIAENSLLLHRKGAFVRAM